MTSALYRLGRWCAANGWRVIAAWVIALLMLGGLARAIPGSVAQHYSLGGTDSGYAMDLLGRAFPGTGGEGSPLLLHSDTLDFSTGEGAATVDRVAASLEQYPQITAVRTPTDSTQLLSPDRHTAQILVTTTERYAADEKLATGVVVSAQQAAGPDVQVELGGFLGRGQSKPETRASEIAGMLAAVVVLYLTLRRAWAAALPLINAMISVGVGVSVITLLSKVVFIPDVAPTLGMMLGLGVGIDYALFLVTRHRLLLREGYEVTDAVGRTSGTAGAAMVFAGGTLVAAVAGLVLTGLNFLAWLGLAAALVVSVAVLASVTFVPAVLGILGDRVTSKRDSGPVDPEALDRSRWAKLADLVTSRPWTFAIASSLVLLALAAPILTLSLGHSDASILPESTTARRAEDLLRGQFGAGESSPLVVVTQLYSVATAPELPKGTKAPSGDPRTNDPRLTELRAAVAATPGVVRADKPVVSTDGGIATMRVVPEWGSSDPRTEELVRELRTTVLPDVDESNSMSSHVGGITAINIDLAALIVSRTPWFILGVVSLAFLLLMLAYRSLLIPAKAAAMNLLSIAAAYGIVTMVFQWGWGATLIGLEGPIPIDSYVPMMIFAVLFGLSMDYEVFLLTAFREQWERTGDMTVSVRRGLADTGRVVTAAALIMVAVFGSFILSPDPTVKIFGIGLASAVAVDATIVRCLLVPAIMVLAQKGTWWLPGWLDRLLPHVHVEGDPAAVEPEALEAAARARAGRAPLVWRRPRATAGAVLGAVLAFAGVLALTGGQGAPAIAVSAVAGGVLAALPAASAGAGRRMAGYVIAVVVALLGAAVALGFVAPTRSTPALAAAAGLLLASLVAVIALPHGMTLAGVLGGLSVSAAMLALGTGDPTQVALVALLPALTAAVVAVAVGGARRAPEQAQEPDEIEQPESAGVGS